jgi:outer membrane protein
VRTSNPKQCPGDPSRPRLPRASGAFRGSVAAGLGAIALQLVAAPARSQEAGEALTLAEALVQARKANARLPVAEMEVVAGTQQVRSARGQLLPRIGMQGDLIVSPSKVGYGGVGIGPGNIGEEKLLIVAQQPLYAGGSLRAGVDGAESQLRSARAAFRVAEKDLELEVRTRFSELLKAQEDVRFRDEGLERLRAYLGGVRDRQAAGQGLLADVLKTQARLSTETADAEEARRQMRATQIALAEILGREPGVLLVAAPLPEPAPPSALGRDAWTGAPELLQTRADIATAQAAVVSSRAARLPKVDLTLDAGLWGGGFSVPLPPGGLSQRLRNDLGVSATLTFSWPFLDFGTTAGQIGLSEARVEQARRRLDLASRDARMKWEAAQADVSSLWAQVALRKRAVPEARDAYLAAESLYRGGSGTALEVLDAFTSLTTASEAYASAMLSFRVAEATALRWGTP